MTNKEWINKLSADLSDHKPDCVCNRCKFGREVFLLESDIDAIIKDRTQHLQSRVVELEKELERRDEEAANRGIERDLNT